MQFVSSSDRYYRVFIFNLCSATVHLHVNHLQNVKHIHALRSNKSAKQHTRNTQTKEKKKTHVMCRCRACVSRNLARHAATTATMVSTVASLSINPATDNAGRLSIVERITLAVCGDAKTKPRAPIEEAPREPIYSLIHSDTSPHNGASQHTRRECRDHRAYQVFACVCVRVYYI